MGYHVWALPVPVHFIRLACLEMSIRGHCGLSLALALVTLALYAQGLQQSATLPAPSALTSRPCGTNLLAQDPAAAR